MSVHLATIISIKGLSVFASFSLKCQSHQTQSFKYSSRLVSYSGLTLLQTTLLLRYTLSMPFSPPLTDGWYYSNRRERYVYSYAHRLDSYYERIGDVHIDDHWATKTGMRTAKAVTFSTAATGGLLSCVPLGSLVSWPVVKLTEEICIPLFLGTSIAGVGLFRVLRKTYKTTAAKLSKEEQRKQAKSIIEHLNDTEHQLRESLLH